MCHKSFTKNEFMLATKTSWKHNSYKPGEYITEVPQKFSKWNKRLSFESDIVEEKMDS